MTLPEDVLPLVGPTDPILFQPTQKRFSPLLNREIVHKQMVSSMVYHCGVGIAGPQVGVPYPVCAVQLNDNIMSMFEPEILGMDTFSKTEHEGCLSFPGFSMPVKRSTMIHVKWIDRKGHNHTGYFRDMDARIIMHEINHLNGYVIFQHGSRYHYDKAMKKFKIPHDICPYVGRDPEPDVPSVVASMRPGERLIRG